MVLVGHLGELLGGGAVLAHVLHAHLGEDGGHGARAQISLRGKATAVGVLPPAAQEAHLAHLLTAYSHGQVVGAGGDGHVRLADGGGAGGAGVGHVHDRDAGLADLVEDALAHHGAGLIEVAAHQELHVFEADAGIVAGQQHRLSSQFVHELLRVASELHEPHADDRYLSHATSPFRAPLQR